MKKLMEAELDSTAAIKQAASLKETLKKLEVISFSSTTRVMSLMIRHISHAQCMLLSWYINEKHYCRGWQSSTRLIEIFGHYYVINKLKRSVNGIRE